VNNNGLNDLLLSPQSKKYWDGYATCTCCYKGMSQNLTKKKAPPKFAIANGFLIGSFPQQISLWIKSAIKNQG
jgi:hypothetical protein